MIWIEIQYTQKRTSRNGAGKTIADHPVMNISWGHGEYEWPSVLF